MAKKILILCLSMLKIGLFTFGGGYAMIALLENEFVTKREWLNNDEFVDVVAISESTPGPIAINMATYIGYRVGKILGAILATICVCIPSFVIIYVISLFLNRFLEITWVYAIFKGLQVSVILLIFIAGFKMLLHLKRSVFNISVFIVTFSLVFCFGLFGIDFSSIFYLLIAAFLGLLIYLLGQIRSRKTKENKEDES